MMTDTSLAAQLEPSDARPLRPVPRPTALTQVFWDACAEGKLLYQFDSRTETAIFPPRALGSGAPNSSIAWRESAGLGTVYSYTVVWRPQTPAFDVPYVVAIVELDEGYTMMTNLTNCPPQEVRIGMQVKVTYFDTGQGIFLPFFEPKI